MAVFHRSVSWNQVISPVPHIKATRRYNYYSDINIPSIIRYPNGTFLVISCLLSAIFGQLYSGHAPYHCDIVLDTRLRITIGRTGNLFSFLFLSTYSFDLVISTHHDLHCVLGGSCYLPQQSKDNNLVSTSMIGVIRTLTIPGMSFREVASWLATVAYGNLLHSFKQTNEKCDAIYTEKFSLRNIVLHTGCWPYTQYCKTNTSILTTQQSIWLTGICNECNTLL